MAITDQIKESAEDLDQPISSEGLNLFKKGKFRIIMIYEDLSIKEYYRKFSISYFITIKKRKYLVIPKCILRGKFSTIIYYFNNPFPIAFDHQTTQMSALDLYNDDTKKLLPENIQSALGVTMIDSEVLRSAFDSNWLQNMYYQKKVTWKALLIIFIVVFVVILIILQVTGVVDVFGALSGG